MVWLMDSSPAVDPDPAGQARSVDRKQQRKTRSAAGGAGRRSRQLPTLGTALPWSAPCPESTRSPPGPRMPRPLRWSQLLPGSLALAGLVALAAGVLLFARVGALRGETLRLYALTSQARGVIKGTEVWVAGQKVGLVETVRFRPPTADTAARVVLVLDVL